MNISPEILTTAVLGSLGIQQINNGSKNYQKKDFAKGSENLLSGNILLTTLAATNEVIRNGMIGVFTGAQTPFTLAGITQYLRHHPGEKEEGWYSELRKIASKYSTLPALATNLALRAWMYSQGFIDPNNMLDWMRHIGFSGLSTSFAMPTEGDSAIVPGINAKQERFLVTFTTRALLTAALAIDSGSSTLEALQKGSLENIETLSFLWMLLNGMGLQQDFRTLKASLEDKGPAKPSTGQLGLSS